MWQHTKKSFVIPTSFKIGGGKVIKVKIVPYLNNGTEYGNWSDAESLIQIAEYLIVDGQQVKISEEDMERTYIHELLHCIQWYYDCGDDEAFAQSISNLLYEYLHTCEYGES